MSKNRLLFIPTSGGGISPDDVYTKEQVDALIADFITNTVDDLTNYYLKSETLTTAEIQALVGQITSFEVVTTLPVSDIKTNVIYLLGPIGSGSDRYEEYIYSNNTFVKIGETSVDLSNYITVNQLNTALGFYTPTAQLATVATSGDYVDLTNKPTIPAAQIQSDWSQSDNSAVDYIKNKPTIPDAVSGTNDGTNWTTLTIGSDTYDIPQGGGGSTEEIELAVAAAFNDTRDTINQDLHNNYATKKMVNDSLSNYATKGALGEFYTKTQVDTQFSNVDAVIEDKEEAISFALNDLNEKTETIPAAQVNSDWNANSGVAQILNKPTTVALTFTFSDQTTATYNVYGSLQN